MSLVSFALAGASAASRPNDLPAGRSDLSGASGAGDQVNEKQQREESARSQRLGDQLRQLFRQDRVSSAVANVQAADASVGAAVASARASATAALSSSSDARHSQGGGNGGTLSLSHAANLVAGARSSIASAKLAALREASHGDLADLVQLDQQAANAQGAIIVNLLV